MEIDRIEIRGTIFLSPTSVNEQPPRNNSSVNNEHLLILVSHCRNMRVISYVEGQLSSLNRNSQISTQHWISRNLFIFGPILIGTFLLILGWGIPRKSLWHRYWNTLYLLSVFCKDLTMDWFNQKLVAKTYARENKLCFDWWFITLPFTKFWFLLLDVHHLNTSDSSILVKPSNTTKYVSLLSLLLSRTTCFGPLSDHHQVFKS